MFLQCKYLQNVPPVQVFAECSPSASICRMFPQCKYLQNVPPVQVVLHGRLLPVNLLMCYVSTLSGLLLSCEWYNSLALDLNIVTITYTTLHCWLLLDYFSRGASHCPVSFDIILYRNPVLVNYLSRESWPQRPGFHRKNIDENWGELL